MVEWSERLYVLMLRECWRVEEEHVLYPYIKVKGEEKECANYRMNSFRSIPRKV